MPLLWFTCLPEKVGSHQGLILMPIVEQEAVNKLSFRHQRDVLPSSKRRDDKKLLYFNSFRLC